MALWDDLSRELRAPPLSGRRRAVLACHSVGLFGGIGGQDRVSRQKNDFFVREFKKMTKFLSGTKLYELAGVTSLITWLGVGILGSFLRISQMLDSRAEVIAIFAQCATALFLSMVVILLVIRLPPVRKAKGALPKLAGTLGCLLPILVLALPRASLTYSMAIFVRPCPCWNRRFNLISLLAGSLLQHFSTGPRSRDTRSLSPYPSSSLFGRTVRCVGTRMRTRSVVAIHRYGYSYRHPKLADAL